MLRLIVILCSALLAGSALSQPLFVNRQSEFDFSHEYTGGWEHFVGGGVAVFDCNDDFLPDLYVAGGEGRARLLVNRTSAPGAAIRFADETPDELALHRVVGAYPIDVDSDGRLDLVVLRAGVNRIMLGGPDCFRRRRKSGRGRRQTRCRPGYYAQSETSGGFRGRY